MRTALAERRPLEFAEARAQASSRAEMARLLGVALNTVDAGITRYGLDKFGRFFKTPKDRKEQVIAAALAGKSYEEIAREFNITRGTVAGIIHRAGVKVFRPKKPKPVREKVVRNFGTRMTTTLELPAVPFEPRVAPVEPLHVSLLDLEWHQCREPYGDGPFTFCGHTAIPGKPYCAHHAAINYLPASARNRAPRPR